MKHKKIHDKAIIVIFTIALFIIIIFGSLNLMIFNKDFYHRELLKNDVYGKLPTGVDADAVADNVIEYFRGDSELQYFTQEEKYHMYDVKRLIRTMQFVYYGAALVSVVLFMYCYKRFKDEKFMFIKILSKSLMYPSIAAVIFLVSLFLLCVFYFDLIFTVFHLLLFPQGNWIFDSGSLLITIFPKQFFFDISLRIFIYAMFQALTFFGIGYWMYRQVKIIEKHHR